MALCATLSAAVTPLEVENNYFFNPITKTRFQIVGVAYQPGGEAAYDPKTGKDPLSHKDECLRDAALLQVLGVNTIRVYNLDPDINHDECASIFNAAGMYMIIDVNSPLVGESLTSWHPWESYYTAYVNRTFAIVEAFKSYPNTLAFFSGNEVINNNQTGADVPPYVRAITRDLKNYVAKHCDRKIPVGYSAADVREVLWDSYNYFQCAINGDPDDMSRADIFALNSYSWCGAATFSSSGYNVLVNGFTGASLPVFYSEYGCNTPAPRIFTEVPAIYGPQMTGVFSGGIVYQYTQEENKFGLVQLADDGSATLLGDFNTLKDQYAKLDFNAVESVKVTTGSVTATPPVCKASLITTENFSTNFTLPAPPPGTPELIQSGVNPRPSGKTITITDWKVKQTIKNADGTVITGLEVKPLPADRSNRKSYPPAYMPACHPQDTNARSRTGYQQHHDLGYGKPLGHRHRLGCHALAQQGCCEQAIGSRRRCRTRHDSRHRFHLL